MFAADDIDEMRERLRKRGAQLVGEVVSYKDRYRLCQDQCPVPVLDANRACGGARPIGRARRGRSRAGRRHRRDLRAWQPKHRHRQRQERQPPGVGSIFSATESLNVDLTVGQYTTAWSNGSVSLSGNGLGVIRLLGAAPRRLFFHQNNDTDLQVGSVLGDVTIDRNTLPLEFEPGWHQQHRRQPHDHLESRFHRRRGPGLGQRQSGGNGDRLRQPAVTSSAAPAPDTGTRATDRLVCELRQASASAHF